MVNATARAAEDHLPFFEVLVAVIAGMVLTSRLTSCSRIGVAFTLLVPALAAYRAEKGVYPPTLAALTPDFTFFILGPLTGRDQIWCYEGGDDDYQLGCVYYQRYYRDTYPTPFFTIKIHNRVGPVPDRPWMCEEEIKRVEITGGL